MDFVLRIKGIQILMGVVMRATTAPITAILFKRTPMVTELGMFVTRRQGVGDVAEYNVNSSVKFVVRD